MKLIEVQRYSQDIQLIGGRWDRQPPIEQLVQELLGGGKSLVCAHLCVDADVSPQEA